MKKLIVLIFSLMFVSCAYATSTNLTPGHLVYTSATNCGPNANAACASDSPVTTNGTTASVGGSVLCTMATGCGNAPTATALAAAPTKCNAGYFPLGIDVNGNAQNCTLNNSGAGSVTNIATSSPLSGGPITSTGTISINVANGSQGGYLTSTDWNTFNGKQANLSVAKGAYVDGDVCTYSASGTLLNCNTSPAGSGTVTSITASSPLTGGTITGSGSIGIPAANGSTNGYLASGDWTIFNSKISANQTITLSGDVSGSGTTAITTAIGSGKVTNAMLGGSIAASKLVGTDIATLGTITSGTWNGSTIAVGYGGTGLSTAPANSLMLGNGTAYNSKTLSDCQDTAGNHLNFNATTGAFSCGSTGPSGAVTSVGLNSPNGTIQVSSTPVTSAGTIGADINWTNFNMISKVASGGVNWYDVGLHALLNMGGINWYDASNVNQGINWYRVDLVTKSLTTNGSGVGNLKMYDSSGVNYVDISAPATIAASKIWVWPGADGSANQVMKTDGSGNLGWATNGSGTVASGTTNQEAVYTGSTTVGSGIITDNGTNVGIGSASPAALLDVYKSNASASTSFHVVNPSSSGYATFELVNDNGFGGAVLFGLTGSTYSGGLTSAGNAILTTNTTNQLGIGTHDLVAITIDGNQNVGIGSATPVGQLTIGNAATHTGIVACFTTGGRMGYCSGSVSGTGCTCTGL